MRELFRHIELLSRSDVPVLIEGETGVGKNLVAQAIHAASPRARAPFLAFSAASISETLFESELFGHVRGAFSGAHQDHAGLARSADGGTLFLNEAGELSLVSQAKLLDFLDRLEVRPVGGVRSSRIDVRVLCATNRDLRSLVSREAFREDLYFRLAVVALRVPSLRERREDIPPLAGYFLERLSRQDGKAIMGLSEGALALLLEHDWRGNVRELESALRRAVLMTPSGRRIEADALHSGISTFFPRDRPEPAAALRECREKAERETILGTVSRHGWNVSAAAKELGITRVGLTRKMKHLGIHRPGHRPGL